MTSDEDIYSIENLIPPPPKPPKQSKKMASNNNKKTLPSERSSSQTSEHHHQHHKTQQPGKVLTTQQEPQKAANKGRNTAITRLQSSPLPTKSPNSSSSQSQFGHSIRSLPSSIERASFCAVNFNRCSSEIEMQGLESATSSSLIHGTILIAIMLSSLAAFVCSKLKDPCEDYFLAPSFDCSLFFSLFFSIINILSCLYAFTVYFLHLVGQCDYLTWSARRKVSLEILCTFMVIFVLAASVLLLLTQTTAKHSAISVISAIFAFGSIVLYCVRNLLLFREMKMLWSQGGPANSRGSSQLVKREQSLQGPFQRQSTTKSSLRASESGSVRASIPTHVAFSQQTRPKEINQSTSFARENQASGPGLEEGVSIETRRY